MVRHYCVITCTWLFFVVVVHLFVVFVVLASGVSGMGKCMPDPTPFERQPRLQTPPNTHHFDDRDSYMYAIHVSCHQHSKQ